MHLDDFDFDLPEALIAQFPLPAREASRLMILNRGRGEISTRSFTDIEECLQSGDVLVVNNTKVIPARLLGHKASGGRVEVFLVRRLAGAEDVWACLTKASKTPKPGTRLYLGEGIEGEVLAGGNSDYRHIRFYCEGDFNSQLEKVGRIPLPPYIRREDTVEDRERYQTVFAAEKGAVAAPTAGLHFTPQVLDNLARKGVEIHPVTLHVGLGTFLPVRCENLLKHRMHEEEYLIPEATAAAINRAKDEGRRVIALGTTTTRTLEYACDDQGRLQAGQGMSDLFIYPGFRFRVIDGLVTNFHLPRSTLLMLVSAFAGRDFILQAYRRAVEEGFRFFSYGDCMLII